jgi:hypothetical protein
MQKLMQIGGEPSASEGGGWRDYASLGNLKQFRNTEILPRQNFGTLGFVAEVSNEGKT